MNKQRRTRLECVTQKIDELAQKLYDIQSEEQDALDNLPEGLQESERDGVHYIFNINDKYDLKCCVEGGLTASEIARLYDETTQGATPLFLFGVNYESPKHITNLEEAKKILLGAIDDVVLYAIAFHVVQGYKAFFDYYIADYVLNNMTDAK